MLEEGAKSLATEEDAGRLDERIGARVSAGKVWAITFTVAGGMAALLLLATRLLPFTSTLPRASV